jgi:hypothetical protein
VAVEHAGPEAARSFVEAAGVTFPTIIDEQGVLSRLFGFKVVPNGVLLDEEGMIRWAKFGGFSVDNPDDVAAVERFLAGADLGCRASREILPDDRLCLATGAADVGTGAGDRRGHVRPRRMPPALGIDRNGIHLGRTCRLAGWTGRKLGWNLNGLAGGEVNTQDSALSLIGAEGRPGNIEGVV